MPLPPALESALQTALDRRRACSTLRILADNCVSSPSTTPPLVDFSSNDYLSLSRSPALRTHFLSLLSSSPHILGSSSSRLLDGNTAHHIALELRLARFFGAEAALLFNSGYEANVGFFSCVPQRGDWVVMDERVHASVWDGVRASRAKDTVVTFRHNDVSALEDALRNLVQRDEGVREGKGTVFIAVESLYSMDGTLCPLPSLLVVVRSALTRGNACVVVDEAHAVGVYGPKGRGWVAECGCEGIVQVRVCTFGKGMGTAGAVVLASPLIRSYLVNYARPLIYTTAMPVYGVIAINAALDFFERGDTEELASRLHSLAQECVSSLSTLLLSHPTPHLQLPSSILRTPTPIIPLLTPTPRSLASFLQFRGYMVRPITYPTVPRGEERVRVCLHAGNGEGELRGLVDGVGNWLKLQDEAGVATRGREMNSKL